MFDIFDDDIFGDDSAFNDIQRDVPRPVLSSTNQSLPKMPLGISMDSCLRPSSSGSGLQTYDSEKNDRHNGVLNRQPSGDKRISSPNAPAREAKRWAGLDRIFSAVDTSPNIIACRSPEILSTVSSEFVFDDDDDDDFANIDLDSGLNVTTNVECNSKTLSSVSAVASSQVEQSREMVPASGGKKADHESPSRAISNARMFSCPPRPPPNSPESRAAMTAVNDAKLHIRDSTATGVQNRPKLFQPRRNSIADEWETILCNEAWRTFERDILSCNRINDASLLKMFNLASVIRKANKKALPNRKVHLMFVLLDTITFSPTDACASFVDPSGKMSATIHRDLLKEYPTQMRPGSVFVLGQVSVFSPRPNSHYLHVTTKNILHMYWIRDQTYVEHKQFIETSWSDLIAEAKNAIVRAKEAETESGSEIVRRREEPLFPRVDSTTNLNIPVISGASVKKVATIVNPDPKPPNVDDNWMDDELDDVFANIDC